jgi:hypothetical protein
MNTGRNTLAASGIITSGLVYGGYDTANRAFTESWNGSAWTEVADLNTAIRQNAGAGADNTSALNFGGGPPAVANTELWNGLAWTDVADLNTARNGLRGAGIATAALAFGGETPPLTAITESWNGSIWTETTDLNLARRLGTGFGTNTAAIMAGGNPVTGATEEWNAGINLGAWYTGGDYEVQALQET